jgi:hypothetical protein
MLIVTFFRNDTSSLEEHCSWVLFNSNGISEFSDFNTQIISKAEYDSSTLQYFYKGNFYSSIQIQYD